MQRQSLRSPGTKLHTHGGADSLLSNDTKLVFKDLPSTSLTPDTDDLDHKSTKPRRLSSSSHSSLSVLSSPPPNPEKLIHLIPFLTLSYFLVSHNPSQSDLAQFNGFNRFSNHIAVGNHRQHGDVAQMVEPSLCMQEECPKKTSFSKRKQMYSSIGQHYA